MDYPIEQFLASYEQLKIQYRNRQISQEQFAETVKQMRGRDANGVYWAVDPYRDNYFRYDGQKWVADNSIKVNPPVQPVQPVQLSLIHISEPTRLGMISYAVFC